MKDAITDLIVGFILDCLMAWPVMLLAGAVHASAPGFPAFGFWTCFLFVVVVFMLTYPIRKKD